MFKWLTTFYHKKLSGKPWCEIVSSGIDKNGMVEMEFDWNDSFIRHLRSNGFNNSAAEEECVREWFQALSSERIVEMVKELEAERTRLGLPSGNITSDDHPNLGDPSHVEYK